MARRTTIYDVAALSGVSAQTVSRVVNDKPHVADDTRERVKRAIAELGYRPNRTAPGLATQRTHKLGIIASSPDSLFNADIIFAAAHWAHSQGYMVCLSVVDTPHGDVTRTVSHLIENQVEGILVMHLHSVELSADIPVPCVSATQPFPGEHSLVVGYDYIDGACQAIGHLLDLGHRHIGVLGVPGIWYVADRYAEGVRRAMAQRGLDTDSIRFEAASDTNGQGGYDGCFGLLRRHPNLTAIFCESDALAIGACRALREMGKRVPGDVSVIGFYDRPLSSYVRPSLTTVRMPREELGELLARLLIDAIERGPVSQQRMFVRGKLVVRESTGPPDGGCP
jgi:DNA-binding LacI/PurR family transcriptional regulator